jgi:hemin uptake protein HemP
MSETDRPDTDSRQAPGAATPSPAGQAAAAPITTASPPLPSDRLLQGRRMVEIAHNGEIYRLQATRLGKLILTK